MCHWVNSDSCSYGSRVAIEAKEPEPEPEKQHCWLGKKVRRTLCVAPGWFGSTPGSCGALRGLQGTIVHTLETPGIKDAEFIYQSFILVVVWDCHLAHGCVGGRLHYPSVTHSLGNLSWPLLRSTEGIWIPSRPPCAPTYSAIPVHLSLFFPQHGSPAEQKSRWFL